MNEGSSLADTSTTQTQTNQSSASDPAAAGANQNNGAAGGQNADNIVDMSKIFGEDFAKDPALSKFKTPGDVVKSYKELQSQIGKPKFDVPGQDAPAEQVSEFYKKLGVPEKADDYGLKADANVPEHNNEVNVQFLKAFGEKAHELKMTATQAQGMQKFFDDLAVNMGKTQAAAQAEEDAKLDSLFDKALGSEKATAAEAMKQDLIKILPQEMRELLTEKVSTEALVAMTLLKKHYEKEYGRSDKTTGDDGNNGPGKSVEELRKEANEIYAKFMKNGLTHPEYKGDKARYDALQKTIAELTNAAQKK